MIQIYDLYYFSDVKTGGNFASELKTTTMQKIFIINGGHPFAEAKGLFNSTLTEISETFFTSRPNTEVRVTNVQSPYDVNEEANKFLWADIIIYHTPAWWFQLPHRFKEYLDRVLLHGVVYKDDGRSSKNPEINYGTGGNLKGKQYMLTTSWNAPQGAFTLPGEFFNQRSVDDGPFYGFHRMNAYLGMEPIQGIHFYDVIKNGNVERDKEAYKKHLEAVFSQQLAFSETINF